MQTSIVLWSFPLNDAIARLTDPLHCLYVWSIRVRERMLVCEIEYTARASELSLTGMCFLLLDFVVAADSQ